MTHQRRVVVIGTATSETSEVFEASAERSARQVAWFPDNDMDHLGVVPGPEAVKVAGTRVVVDLGRTLGSDGLDHVVGHRA